MSKFAIAHKMKMKMAKGGMAMDMPEPEDHEADMVHRILKKCYASGGAIANDDQPMVDEEPAQFDYLVKEGGLEDHSSAGNEHDDHAEDMDREDIVKRVLKSRGKKDHNPRPA